MEYFQGIAFLVCFFLLCFLIYRSYAAGRWNQCLVLILLFGLGTRMFMATDYYLHTWDERYHALVAKHLLNHPLDPLLYENPVLDADFKDWNRSPLWLAKPILPLWGLAISMKIFGTHEFALRLPSILVGLFSIYLSYYIGKELFGVKVGLISSFLHAIHGLSLELQTGMVSSDHVETFFLFTVQLGIFCSILFCNHKDRKYIYLIGFCMAMAILSKWISGFFILFIFIGFQIHHKYSWIHILKINTIVCLISFLLVAPWIIYLSLTYPEDSQWIIENIFQMISQGEKIHAGTPFYYLDEVRILFGELIYLPLGWLAYRYIRINRPSTLGFLFYWIGIPLVLLSIAEFKRHTYILVSAPAFFVLTAFFLRYLAQIKSKINFPKTLTTLMMVLLIALPIRYAIERIKPFKERLKRPDWYCKMESELNMIDCVSDQIVLVGEPHQIEAMFYFDVIAYDYVPDSVEVARLNSQTYCVYRNIDGAYVRL